MGNMNKTKVDLITGFLGAGKTTFIKKYLESCRDERTIVIENEFGRAGIDLAILREESAEVVQLAGGCICCGLKVNFHDLLVELSENYDRIIVEPSGIYTLEDFFDIMESPVIESKCIIGSILMIADPEQLNELDTESEHIVYSQLAGAGRIIVSKTGIQNVVLDKVISRINQILTGYGNSERNAAGYILAEEWDCLDENVINELKGAGYCRNRKNLPKQDHSTIFYNTSIVPCFDDCKEMETFLKQVLYGDYGNVIRAKGFLKCRNGLCYEINCTPRDWSIKEVNKIQDEGINLIGRGIDRKAIKNYMNKNKLAI